MEYSVQQIKKLLDSLKAWSLRREDTSFLDNVLEILNYPIKLILARLIIVENKVAAIESDLAELFSFQAFTYSNDEQSVEENVAITSMEPNVGRHLTDSVYIVYSFAITAGALPTGVTLNTDTGVISGTPTEVGEFTPTITVSADKLIKPSTTVQITLTITEAV